MRPPIEELVARLGVPLRDPASIGQALVHSSYRNENPALVEGHNERLEFLGDAVISLVVSDVLFTRYPQEDEGFLTSRRAALVNRSALAAMALDLGLERHVLLGRGETDAGGGMRPSVLAAAFEALAGAIHRAEGFEIASAWLRPLFEERIDATVQAGPSKSAKSLLQERTQRTHHAKPRYELVAADGPPHERRFTVAAVIDERHLGVGEGASRRAAEERAAAAALELLDAADGSSSDGDA